MFSRGADGRELQSSSSLSPPGLLLVSSWSPPGLLVSSQTRSFPPNVFLKAQFINKSCEFFQGRCEVKLPKKTHKTKYNYLQNTTLKGNKWKMGCVLLSAPPRRPSSCSSVHHWCPDMIKNTLVKNFTAINKNPAGSEQHVCI